MAHNSHLEDFFLFFSSVEWNDDYFSFSLWFFIGDVLFRILEVDGNNFHTKFPSFMDSLMEWD